MLMQYFSECHFCYKLQNLTAKNQNGTPKNVQKIIKSNAQTLLKLGVCLDHMYTKGWIFFLQLCNVLMD